MQFFVGGLSVLLFSLVFINSSSGATSSAPEAPTLCVNSADKGERCSLAIAHGSFSPGTYPKNISDPSNFHPGHWLKVADPNPSYMYSLMNELEGTNIRGIEIWHRWDRLEPGSPGDYSGQYWDQLESWMSQAQSQGLAIIIRIRTHMFRAGGSPYTPDYMMNNSVYGGSPGVYGSYCSTDDCQLRPAWHDPDTVARAKALVDEFKRRWGSQNHFEGVGIQESAPGKNAAKTPGWSSAAHADGIVSLMSYAKRTMPNKTAIPNLNWHPKMSYLLSELGSAGIGLGCPDSPANGNAPDAAVSEQMRSRYTNEDHSPGVSVANPGHVSTDSVQTIYDRITNNRKVWRIVWDDDWLKEGLIAFAEENELATADAFYNR